MFPRSTSSPPARGARPEPGPARPDPAITRPDLAPVARPRSGGALRLWRAFRHEQSDPERFYTLLAEDAVRQLARHRDLEGSRIVDVGGGAGYFTAALRAHGAQCVLVEPDPAELLSRGGPVSGAVIGDGYWLPLADASMDVCFCYNVLEHVRDPAGLIDEMVRVTRPGGLIYLAYTIWWSPWGGHETSPWHYLGGEYAARRFTRKHGRPPKNRYGETMFAAKVAPTLRLVRSRPDLRVLEARPRYYPRWCRFLVRLPVLRELLTWNLLLILQRTA